MKSITDLAKDKNGHKLGWITYRDEVRTVGVSSVLRFFGGNTLVSSSRGNAALRFVTRAHCPVTSVVFGGSSPIASSRDAALRFVTRAPCPVVSVAVGTWRWPLRFRPLFVTGMAPARGTVWRCWTRGQA
jgi:hypothetical protein